MRPLTLTLMLVLASAARASDHELHVMAFNVLFRGANDRASLDAIALEAPDVLCLTELTPTFVRAFERRLSREYPYRHFAPQAGTWGVGLASKYPLADVRVGPVSPSRIPDMQASVQLGGRTVHLDCLHLQPPLGKHRKDDDDLTTLAKNAAVRELQAKTLVTRFALVREPVILLGDFNEDPGGNALMALLSGGFARGCAEIDSGCTPTFPGPIVPRWPAFFTIDHVFARGLTFTMAKTVRGGGSDHAPVAARVSLQGVHRPL